MWYNELARMWAIVNHKTYDADGGWVQGKDASKIGLLVLKATIDWRE